FAGDEGLSGAQGWRCRVADQPKGVRLRLLFHPGDPASANGTVVTLRTQAHSFSFGVADLERGPIYIKDYGVLITWGEAGADPSAAFTAAQARLAAAPKPLYERV